MLQRYGGGNMDEGWTRLMFEQFNVPYKSIMDAEIKAGNLEAKYDTIILPADSIAAMTGERPPQGGAGGGGGGGFGGGPDNTPAEFRSGFGAEGVKALQAFVQKGGTLLTFANAGDLPIQRFGLPLRNIVAGLPSKTVLVAGIDAARDVQQHQPARLRHAARRAGAVHGRRPGLRSDVDRTQPGRRDPRRPTSSATSCRAAGCSASR